MAETQEADLAFVDGRYFDGEVSVPGTVAVRGGRIAAAGDRARELIGRRTEVVSLRGRLLVPGFIDAHAHPVWAGLELGSCAMPAEGTAADCVRAVAEYAASHPEAAWITGGGWSMTAFPGGVPHRRDLDAVVADRPVYLPNRDHHGAWVNTRALELAGIDARTPDPPGGRIERDPDGTPCGMLQESATDLVSRLVPPVGDTAFGAALDRAQRVMHELGVVAWQDAIVGPYLGQPDPFETYLRAAAGGRLTARVTGALWWDRERGAEQIDDLLARRARAGAGRFGARTVKFMLDGVAETQTAAMLAPYLDRCGCSTGAAGESFLDPVLLREYVTLLDGLGFQMHFHALGDRAVRDALDALAAARDRNGSSSARHHLAHVQVVHPDDIGRFAALGATATVQALWACHDDAMDVLTIPFLGSERTGWQYPFGALRDAGARIAAGSDWPVSSPDPLAGIHVAVNRVAPDHGSEPFLPEQRLTLAQALRAYTAGSAHVTHCDDAGVIAPGRLADLAVLDRDILAGPPGEIAGARVLATYVDGAAVYAAGTL